MARPMTENERDMLTIFCGRIKEEKDPDVLTELLKDLNKLLDEISEPIKSSDGEEANPLGSTLGVIFQLWLFVLKKIVELL